MNLEHIINKHHYRKSVGFYNALIKKALPPTHTKKKILLVCPGYNSTLSMIESISKNFDLCGIILKNSTNKNNLTRRILLRSNYPILDISKSDMTALSDETVSTIERAIGSDGDCIVLDHGGYFSLNPNTLKVFKPNMISGIAEYAINGENRYLNSTVNDRPMISIGRLSIKKKSDFASSDSIMLVSELYLQNEGIMLFGDDIKVGIIGHGTLGGRIRYLLQERGVKNFLVYDIDEKKLNDIALENIAPHKTELLKQCDVLFCATGNKAITKEDLKFLKDGAIILTVTSPDDELDLPALKKQKLVQLKTEKCREQTFIYSISETGHELVLPFDGESPNTQISFGIADASIHQPCATHIVAGIRLMQGCAEHKTGMHALSLKDELMVEQVWDEHFKSLA